MLTGRWINTVSNGLRSERLTCSYSRPSRCDCEPIHRHSSPSGSRIAGQVIRPNGDTLIG